MAPRLNGLTPSNDTLMLALEPRLLFDAAGLIAGLDLMPQPKATEIGGTPCLIPDLSTVSPDMDVDLFSDLGAYAESVPPTDGEVNAIVFVDTGVADYENLINDLPSDTLAVILEPGCDGITQIGDVLSQYRDVEAVHIISHGSSGSINLGDAVLSNDTIDEYATDLQEWGSSLAGGADILVYGCNVSSGVEGQSFVAQLSDITGADVAASDDVTGAAGKGGDWDLETRTGIIESGIAVTEQFQDAYSGALAEITVDSSDDIVDGADGVTTLREALAKANGNGEADTITFDAALMGSTITLNGSELAITGNIGVTTINGDIDGDNVADITLDGNKASRIFSIDGLAWATLNGLTITNGYSGAGGGGIYNEGNLDLTACTLSQNISTGGRGGGAILNFSYLDIKNSSISQNYSWGRGGGISNYFLGDVEIENTTISDNFAFFSGGGIQNHEGTVTIENTTISGNTALQREGGGITNVQNGIMEIENTTISGNTSGIWGGGIANAYGSAGGYMEIENTTISGNTAGDRGGGISNAFFGHMEIENTTISGNTSDSYGGGIYNHFRITIDNSTISGNSADIKGGGIFNINGTGYFETSQFSHTTITDNTSPVGSAIYTSNDDGDTKMNHAIVAGGIAGTSIDSQGYNLFTQAVTGSIGSDGVCTIGELNLQPLADNGGPTLTHALGAGSSALEAGDKNAEAGVGNIPEFDQRGTGYSRVEGQTIDIGAVEMSNDAPTANDDEFITNKTTTITIDFTANDTEPDAIDTLSVESFDTTGTKGTVTDNGDGTFNYDPNGQFNALGESDMATDTFTYEVSDGRGGTDTATVTMAVHGGNVPPTAGNDDFTTDEDTAFTTGNVLSNDTDWDTDPVSVESFDTTATKGTVTDNGDGTFSYDPNGQFDYLAQGGSATDTFTYSVSDGNGGTDTATVTITVSGINDSPATTDDSDTTDEETAITTGNVLANDTDPEGDSFSLTGIDTTATKGIVTNNGDGTFEYDPDGQFNNLYQGQSVQDTFTYTVTDSNGATDTATVTISVTGIGTAPSGGGSGGGNTGDTGGDDGQSSNTNTQPEGGDDAVSGGGNSSFTFDVLSNDTDSDASDNLTITGIDTSNTLGIVTDNGDGTFSYDPNGQFDHLDVGETASDTFTYTVSDGNGGTDTVTVTITITGTTRSSTGLVFNTPTADASFGDLFSDLQRSDTPWYQIWTGNEGGTEGDYVDTGAFYANGNGWIQGDDLAGLFPDYCQADDTAIWVRTWTQAGGYGTWASSAMPFDLIDSVNACDSVTGPVTMDQMFNDEHASTGHWYRIWIGESAGEDTSGSFLDTSALNNGAATGWARASELALLSFTPDDPGTSKELWVQSWSSQTGNLGWENWTVTCTQGTETAQIFEPDTDLDVVGNENQLLATVEPVKGGTQYLISELSIVSPDIESTGNKGFNDQLQIAGNAFEKQRSEFLERLSA